jgi:hypothetical protein
MELWRRVFLISSLFAAILFALFADLSPVVIVSKVDFSDQQKKEGSYMGVRLMTDRTERLAGLPLHDYIAEATKGRLFNVEGRGWEPAVENAVAARGSRSLSKEWQKRLPSDQHPMGVLFFRPEEAPVNQLATLFQKSNDPVFLVQGTGEKAVYLKAETRVYSDGDFHLGSGFSHYPTPPTDFIYPLRKWSPWVALAGLALYVAIPWPKRPSGAMSYRRWRVVLCDVAAVIMTIPFFAFPFFIVGGVKQAFTEGWPLFFFFWPIVPLGILLVFLAAWFSSFSLLTLEDRLRIWNPWGPRDYPYEAMEYFQPVVIKPPKWLIALTWLAALAGKGNMRVGATGRALLMSSAAWGALGIRLRSGKDLIIGIADQLGTDTLDAGKIIGALKKAGVKEVAEEREIRSMGLEMLRLPEA